MIEAGVRNIAWKEFGQLEISLARKRGLADLPRQLIPNLPQELCLLLLPNPSSNHLIPVTDKTACFQPSQVMSQCNRPK
jgi:hypothetical protein